MTATGIADLPLVGGHPALDLVNTVEPRLPAAGRHEHLKVPGDVLTWALRTQLVDPAEGRAVAAAWAASPAAADRALSAILQTREALSVALSALLSPPSPTAEDDPQPDTQMPAQVKSAAEHAPGPLLAELEYLSVTWSGAAGRSRLTLGSSGGPLARLAVGSSAALLVPDRAAHAAVDLLCHADPRHLGMCPVEAGGCGWVFIDRSRNRSRRWCAMQDCGAHVKAKRLTERRRTVRSGY